MPIVRGLGNASSPIANASTSSIPSNGGNGTSIFDILGLVFGVVSLLAVVESIHTGIHERLPAKRLKHLDEALHETVMLFGSVLDDDLFPNQGAVRSMEHRLSNLRRDADRLRAKVHVAISFKDQVYAWWHGVAKRANDLKREVESVRAEISTTCDRERKRQERGNLRPYRYPRLLLTNVPAVSGATPAAGLAAPDHVETISAVNPRFGRATGATGLYSPYSGLSTRAPVHPHPPVSPINHRISAPPPAFVSPSPAGVTTSAPDNPHQRLKDLTDELSGALGDHGRTDTDIVHTPDHVACCNASPQTTEIQRTLNVLNDLTLRLSVIAASELLGSQNEQTSSKPIDSSQLGLLLDGLKVAQAAAQRSPTDLPSTATIVEVSDDSHEITSQAADGPMPEPSTNVQS